MKRKRLIPIKYPPGHFTKPVFAWWPDFIPQGGDFKKTFNTAASRQHQVETGAGWGTGFIPGLTKGKK